MLAIGFVPQLIFLFFCEYLRILSPPLLRKFLLLVFLSSFCFYFLLIVNFILMLPFLEIFCYSFNLLQYFYPTFHLLLPHSRTKNDLKNALTFASFAEKWRGPFGEFSHLETGEWTVSYQQLANYVSAALDTFFWCQKIHSGKLKFHPNKTTTKKRCKQLLFSLLLLLLLAVVQTLSNQGIQLHSFSATKERANKSKVLNRTKNEWRRKREGTCVRTERESQYFLASNYAQ